MTSTLGLVRFGRIGAVVAIAALLIGAIPGRALAAKGTGSYTSPTYGFSVTWDGDTWEDAEVPATGGQEGVKLTTDASWVQIVAQGQTDADADACLTDLESMWAESDGVDGFRAAPRATERPESPLGGAGNLSAMTLTSSDGPADLSIYLECLPIARGQAIMMVSMVTTEAGYTDELPGWNALLGGIAVDEGGDATPDTQVHGSLGKQPKSGSGSGSAGTYAGEQGYAVTWDEATWTGTPYDDASGTGIELETTDSIAYVRTLDAADEIAFCPEDIAYELQSGDNFEQVRKAPGSLERPELTDGAVGALYTAVLTGSATKDAVYVECRPLDDETYLVALFFVLVSRYPTELPAWQALLDGIEIDASTTIGD